MFEVTPGAQKLFPKFADIPRNQLESDNNYRKHSLSVVKTVKSGVESLNDIPTLSELLRQLGKRHLEQGIEEAHFDVSYIDFNNNIIISINY